ncbi:TldD/PmbA family protein [Methanococcus voltae]|uniref:Peptidase U62 modulator of DNA gyrase n=1 Tax=Methanococcus voltae (strain ATCC BAA-1334 / A3) TaxID=456320 RepID=D7DUE2_METV3|nr:TldD/PmbA family protein [Methanococcus voltae]MCS3900552.1 PmbA protein [Methanococcus voltae]
MEKLDNMNFCKNFNDIDNTIDKILNIAEKEGYEADIYISKDDDFSAELEGKHLDNVETSDSFGMGVRVIKDGKVGLAYSTVQSPEIIYKAMANLVKDKYTEIPSPQKYKTPKGIFFKELREINQSKILEDVFYMAEELEKNNITAVGGGVSTSYGYSRLINTNGIDVEEEGTYYSASISGIKDGETAYEYLTKNNMFNVDIISDYVINILKNTQSIKESFEGNIVLSPRALYSLLAYTLIPAFNAESVQRNRSMLAGKIGEKIFGENISIYDDSTLDNALYSSKTDDEGIPSQRTVLVEDGILKNYLYDIKRANIENESKKDEKERVKTTGNASRGYSSLPSISSSNIIINPVEKIEELDKYLYVNSLIGTHTSNPITGDFSVEISNSYIVNKGDKTPVKKGMLSGNIFEILKEAVPLDNVEQRGKLIAPALKFNGKTIIE